MIVNSSRGGGSKDTWVLEDGQDTDRAEPTMAATLPPALPDLQYGSEWSDQQQQQQQECEDPVPGRDVRAPSARTPQAHPSSLGEGQPC
jgi:hypothetical protein